MKLQRLRDQLSAQFAVVAVLPFLLAALAAAAWLYLQTGREIEGDQRQLASTVATQVRTYLEASLTAVQAATSIPQGHLPAHELWHVLDAQVRSAHSIRSLSLVEGDGRVAALAIAGGTEAQHRDLTGIDLSRNGLFRQAKAERRPVWSDTYLSVVGGGLSVGLAVPYGDRVVVGEVNLDRLTEFLRSVDRETEELILVVDRSGQVIADPHGRFTAQQLNVGNVPIVRDELATGRPFGGSFSFDGRRMIGSVVPIAGIPWRVLAAVPEQDAFRPVWSVLGISAAGLGAALGVGLFVGVRAARRLARRFEALAEHARRVAAGETADEWPGGRIAEFNQLAADLQRMDRAIRERGEFLDTVVENIPDVIVVKDVGDLRVVKANRAAEQFWGASREEMLGKRLDDLSSLPQAEVLTARDRRAIEAGEAQDAPEEVVTTASRGDRVVRTQRLVLRDAAGRPAYLLGISEDVTERLRAEQEREELQARLAQAQKLEAIGTLAGGIAHDFNNILNAILGFSELTLLGLPEGSPHRENIERVLEAGERAAGLVRQILTFAREAKRGEGPLYLKPVVAEVLKLLRATLPATIEIRPDLRSEGRIVGDPTEVHQILMNLCTNASLAMPDGGEIRVIVEDVELDAGEAAALQVAAPGPYVRLVVADSGVGIPADVLPRIFEPFFTTREPGKGTGLGLSMVHGIVRRAGGGLTVESRPGEGTTFRILLPAASGEPAQAAPAPKPVGGAEHILFVDDEEMLCSLAERTLGQLGYRVTARTSSREAAELLRGAPDAYDLLVTDMTMPELTGEQLAREARAVKPGLPVILATGYSETMTPERARELGIDQLLPKPFLMSDLARAIRQILERRSP